MRYIMYILLGIAALFVLLLIIAIIRTIAIKAPKRKASPLEVDSQHAALCAEKRRDMVRLKKSV